MEKTWFPLKYESADWCEKLSFSTNVPSLPLARNILTKLALDAQADFLFFIDGDILFDGISPNEALRRLFLAGKPIVAGVYTAKTDKGFFPAIWAANKNGGKYENVPLSALEITSGSELIQADATGLGCCLIDTKVFDRIEEPFFHWDYPHEMSEDFYFFEKVRRLGETYRPFIDLQVKLSHIGTMIVDSKGEFRTKSF